MFKSSNNNKIVLLLSALAIFAPRSEAWAEFQPPKIYPPTPGGYMIYQAGSTARFRCEGTLNGVTWVWPDDVSDSLKRRFFVEYDTNHQHFTAELTIRDLNFADTNTLMCAYNGTSDLTAIDKSTPIHLYVEDKEHPLKYSGYEFLQVVQSQTFILPCMPTHPDVNVSLWKQGKPIVNSQYITFDPKVIIFNSG